MSLAVSQEVLISRNPATGEEIGKAKIFSKEEVRQVINRARSVFQTWRKTSFDERKHLIMRAREVILAEMDEIAELICKESGKPIAEAISMEIAPVLDLMQYFARNTKRLLKPRKVNIGLFSLLGRSSEIIYEPVGVVVIIPAWNYPFSIPLGEATMALMAGNTVIIKPSELTPFVGLKIEEIFRKAGALEGTIQVITGDGSTGAALVEAAPDKIMFTGSVSTGKKIAQSAAKNLTPVVLELGGKDPMIVFADANLNLAAEAAVWAAFCNAGQNCASVERLYVEESIAKDFTKLLIEKTKKLKQGIGTQSDISITVLSSEKQLQIVKEHVESFKKEGAKILLGGQNKGLFFEPTIIADVNNSMKAMREETFGPTLPIATFRDEEEAIRLANDSEFGLTASVWTSDLKKARRVAEKLEAGTVCINEVLYTHAIAQTPWGGVKMSGYGRTHGLEGLMELVNPKHIHLNRLLLFPDAWWMPYSETAINTFKGFAKYFASGSLIKTLLLLPMIFKRIKELTKK
ncbi:MAG: aldehyde dehydrogenase family protein [Pyrinomonadaceae bacterium]|nr:aldehyde dehydrogenase family protein [Pyrinomonadaceae bacterium]MCX7640816.1 aldehyde dehydrogenase family protein [Pyrinomonadaceae bacterium]MDW8303419.1 aldehyde dehydrogenase family protein [Acidobacteriota bacterium]